MSTPISYGPLGIYVSSRTKQITNDHAQPYTAKYQSNIAMHNDRTWPNHSSMVPSLTESHSSGEGDAGHICPSVDLAESINARLDKTIEPTSLDRGLIRQAQASGTLRAKQLELAGLQALAQQRLQRARGRFAAGLAEANSTRKDLEWSQKRISALKVAANDIHPAMYRKAITNISGPIPH